MEAKVTNLFQWLGKSDKFQFIDSIQVVDSVGSGHGIYLQKHIKLPRNKMLISIPSSYQLNFHTVLYHISKFNKSIAIPNVTCDDEDEEDIKISDPRYKAYSVLTQEFLLSLSSFQILCLYILAEWVFLPEWSRNDPQATSFWQPFFDVWPSIDELDSIPTIWNCQRNNDYSNTYEILIGLLPYASSTHMLRITKLVQNDWGVILPIISKWNEMFPMPLSMDDQFNKFLHIYFIINSRCLYCEIPLKKKSSDRIISNFTMVPLVDFLNHSVTIDKYCYPELQPFQKDGIAGVGQFMIRVGNYEYHKQGEQIYLNYGPHSNDFLLNEYGFVVNDNQWDFIDITQELWSLLENSSSNKDELDSITKFLRENDYWGDYTINKDEISYRTMVAISLIVTKDFERVQKFMLGYINEEYFVPKIKVSLSTLLNKLLLDASDKLQYLNIILERIEHATLVRSITYLINIYQGYIRIIQTQLDKLNG